MRRAMLLRVAIIPARNCHEPGNSASRSWCGRARPRRVLSASLRQVTLTPEETLEMNQEATLQSYRGVRCLSCRQPIPLPAILLKMDSSPNRNEAGMDYEYPTRVFSLRCRSCEREKPYRAADIVEFEGAPRTRVSRSRLIHSHGQKSGGQTRAANS
jgi:hypothetical protein